MTDSMPAATVPPQQPTISAKTLNALLHMPAQMELSQIELIYRAEGNANLVLALPQFKKVLRLPKMISSRQTQRQSQSQAQHSCQPADIPRPEGQPSVSDPTKASSAKAGDLTMPDFMAYIEIMRRLLGNEFVCEADIVAIPKEGDRFWINEHIRAHRPVARLDKEFVGPFGLVLPDVTQLPATFDVLLANLQAKDMNTDVNVDICTDSSSSSISGTGCGSSSTSTCSTHSTCSSRMATEVTRLGHIYAIEIKPKQGWLQLASDVSNLFDLMPASAETMGSTSDPKDTVPGQKCRCRYCSMQLVKLHKNKIKRLGDYCPLQLFSGTACRMLDALNALFACPQNNLRVFQSGNLIYGDHANSISCEELHTRVFPGEIMALIKHLLVACLLREYNNNKNNNTKELAREESKEDESINRTQSRSHVASAAIGDSELKRRGTETKVTKTTEIGAANADVDADADADAVDVVVSATATATAWHERARSCSGASEAEFVKAAAGQPQPQPLPHCSMRAAGEKATQRYTKRSRLTTTTITTATITTATSTTATSNRNITIAAATRTCLSANVALANTTQTETETKTLTSVLPSSTLETTRSPILYETQAQINDAEIFHLPKNCVLQKILHLQLLAKHHFHYMWQAGYAEHATPTYQALQSLLNCPAAWDNVDQLTPEQAYMLGATALDCSLMVTFQEIRCAANHNSSLTPWLVTLQGRQFLTKVSVLDLDPKPDSHFHKFIKQTREIEKCCRALN